MIQPRDDAFSGFTLFLARLWHAKFYILATGFLLAVVTYVDLKFFTLETFRSEAILYLSKDIQGPTVTTLITSSEAIDTVRTRFKEQFPSAKGLAYLDRFVRRFHINNEVVEDNSLRKVYSPALVIAADANSPREAQTLTTIWIDEITKRFGGASGDESRFRIENTQRLLDDLRSREQQGVQRATALQVRATELESRLYNLINLLAPADLSAQTGEREFNAYLEDIQQPSKKVSVTMPARVAPAEPGLIEREMRIQTDLDKLRAELQSYEKQAVELGAKGSDWKTVYEMVQQKLPEIRGELAGKEAERTVLSRQIVQVRDEISSLSLVLKAVKADLAAAQTDLAAIRLQQEFAGSSLALHTVPGYLSGAESRWGPQTPARLDFAVISPPSLPDRKVGPKRLLSAILAAVIGGFLSCTILGIAQLVEHLPKLAPVERKRSSIPAKEPPPPAQPPEEH